MQTTVPMKFLGHWLLVIQMQTGVPDGILREADWCETCNNATCPKIEQFNELRGAN